MASFFPHRHGMREIFSSPRHFPVQPARRYIFRMDPSLNFSTPFCFLPSFFPPFSFFHARPPLAFAFYLSVRHLERVYFRLVSKVNNVVYGLAYSASASHDANKSDASRKESTGRTRIKTEPANRNVRLQAASVRQLGDDLSSCPFGS